VQSSEPSRISIQRSELPYSKFIAGIAPVLHLQLEKLSLTFEFGQGFTGNLSIEVPEDVEKGKVCEVIDIKDIPTADEMRVNCSETSDELVIELQKDKRGIVYFTFVWDKSGNKTEIVRSGTQNAEAGT